MDNKRLQELADDLALLIALKKANEQAGAREDEKSVEQSGTRSRPHMVSSSDSNKSVRRERTRLFDVF